MTSKFIHKDRVLGLIMLALTGFFGFHTMRLPESVVQGDPGPKVFPYIGCFLMGVIGISYLFKKHPDTAKEIDREELKRLVLLFSLYVLFFVVLWLFGYLVAIPVATFLISMLFSREANIKTRNVVIYTVLVTLGIYIAYVVALGSSLPKGIFWNLFR